MADRNRKGFGAMGVGATACAACCAAPLIGVLAAASLATLVGVALFGTAGLAFGVALLAVRSRRHPSAAKLEVPVVVGRKPND